MALTPAVAADVAADQRWQALITDISIGDSGADATDFFSLGRIDEAALTITPVGGKSSGGVPIQGGYLIELSAMVLASGTNITAAIASIIQNDHDTTLTDAFGATYTYLSAQFQLQAGRVIEGDFEGLVKIPITGGGYLTTATYISTYTAPS